MATILDNIIKHKKQEIRRSKREVRVAALWGLIKQSGPPRPFSKQLDLENDVAIIAEIKKASPSAGILRPDFDPVAIAATYSANGARAISVLTDEKYFAGNRNYLAKIRPCMKLPLLRKDFIVDPYQVIEARAYGADAILVILNLISTGLYYELLQAAQECMIEVLVEVHNREELHRALTQHCKLIGINNRDLKNFEVDITTTEKLVDEIPRDVIVVSESGIKSRQQVDRLGKTGVDAVLIGEALMREQDVGAALKQFVGVRKWSR
ncbi:MAG TPA: indole-3-glycerol phosphate synthase TrpC [bacterium]